MPRHLLGDRPADRIYAFLFSLKFWKEHRYWPHFGNPAVSRKKFAGACFLIEIPFGQCCRDKWRVRGYVATKVGSEYLVPVLWRGDNPGGNPFWWITVEVCDKGYFMVANTTSLSKIRRSLTRKIEDSSSRNGWARTTARTNSLV